MTSAQKTIKELTRLIMNLAETAQENSPEWHLMNALIHSAKCYYKEKRHLKLVPAS